jgi:hypothetical protein
VVFLLTAGLSAACTGSTPPSPSGPSPGTPTVGVTSSPAGAQCDVRTTRVLVHKISRKNTTTGATRVIIKKGGERSIGVVEKDVPVTTEIKGIPSGAEWFSGIIGKINSPDITVPPGTSPPLTRTDGFVAQLEDPDTYIAYTAVRMVIAPLTITCATGSVISAELTTWERPTSGVVQCSLALSDKKGMGALAKRSYCYRD